LHPSGVAKSSTSFGWGKGGKITSAGWQVTLCDLIWHVISRIGVVISITNCYIRFTLLLLYYIPLKIGDVYRRVFFLYSGSVSVSRRVGSRPTGEIEISSARHAVSRRPEAVHCWISDRQCKVNITTRKQSAFRMVGQNRVALRLA